MIRRSTRVLLLAGLLVVSTAAGLATVGSDVVSGQDDSTVVIVETDLPTEMRVGQSFTVAVTVENRGAESVDLWVSYEWSDRPGTSFQRLHSRTVKLNPGEQTTKFIGPYTPEEIADLLWFNLRPGDVLEHRVAVFPDTGLDYPNSRGPLIDERSVRVTVVGDESFTIATYSDTPTARAATSGSRDDTPVRVATPVDDDTPVDDAPARDDTPAGDDTPGGDGARAGAATPAVERTVAAVGGEARDARSRGFFSNSGTEPPIISNVFNLTILGFVLSIVGLLYQMFEGR